MYILIYILSIYIDIKSGFIREYTRGIHYAHLIGYTSKDNKSKTSVPEMLLGKMGLEKFYDNHLKGIPGSEEIEVIKPVIDKLKKNKLNIDGPEPADTAFVPEKLDKYDAYLSMFHDQGLPVLKTLGFGNSINITLGLPFIRVSVDHGTATELVGTGKVDISSFTQALKVARDISKSAV